MKNKRLLKIAVFVAAVVLIALVSFVGIYKYEKGEMVSVMKEYQLAREFNGSRLTTLKVDTSTKEAENTATEISDENTEEKSEEKTTIPVNAPEVLTKDNYILTKNIIEKRLRNLNINDYDVRVNEENGEMGIELPDISSIDDILQIVVEPGDFKIIATESKDELLNKDDIKSISDFQYSGKSGTAAYLNILFKDAKKLSDITKEYTETTADDGTKTKKTITIKIDDQTFLTTYFGEEISDGQIQIPIGDETSDKATLQTNMKNAKYLATLLNGKTLPIVYTLEQNQVVSPVIDYNAVRIAGTIAIVVLTLIMTYLIIKYKENGLIIAVALIGFISILMLAIRYMNVSISIGSVASIILLCLMEIVFLIQLAKDNTETEMNKSIVKSILLQIPLYLMSAIIVLISAFLQIQIISFATALFIGLLIALAYNYFIVRNILKD